MDISNICSSLKTFITRKTNGNIRTVLNRINQAADRGDEDEDEDKDDDEDVDEDKMKMNM